MTFGARYMLVPSPFVECSSGWRGVILSREPEDGAEVVKRFKVGFCASSTGGSKVWGQKGLEWSSRIGTLCRSCRSCWRGTWTDRADARRTDGRERPSVA